MKKKFLHMADFNWQISLRTKITLVKIWKVPILSNSVTECAYHRFVDMLGCKLLLMMYKVLREFLLVNKYINIFLDGISTC